MTETIDLNTNIPNLAGESEMSDKKVQLSINENQLWYIFIGLERNNKLTPVLNNANKKLAKEIYKIGVDRFKWV